MNTEVRSENSDERFVAFCDILGFSERTVSQFDETVEAYKRFGDLLSQFPMTGATATIYSDAILLTSKSLAEILQGAQILWFFALQNDLMIRGGISKGRYWEQHYDRHLMVVSDALVRAVKIESKIGIPAIVLADDIEVPIEFWVERFKSGAAVTPVLYFDDKVLVNPFNGYWLRSAGNRATMLMNESPAHRDKYSWFLNLHRAVVADEELVPPCVLAKLLEMGVLKRIEPGSDASLRP